MANPNLSGWTPNALTPAGKRLAYTQKRNAKSQVAVAGTAAEQAALQRQQGTIAATRLAQLQQQGGHSAVPAGTTDPQFSLPVPGALPIAGEPGVSITKDYTSDAARNAGIAKTKLMVAELVAAGANPAWFDSVTGEPVNEQGLQLLYPGMQMQGQAGSPMPGAPLLVGQQPGTPLGGQQQLALLQSIASRKPGTSFGRKGVANSWLQRMSDGWN